MGGGTVRPVPPEQSRGLWKASSARVGGVGTDMARNSDLVRRRKVTFR